MRTLVKFLDATRNSLCGVIAALVLSAPCGYAAEQTRRKAYFEPRFFFGPILHVDDKEFETSWWNHTYEDASDAFKANSAASREFEAYLDDAKFGRNLGWGLLGGAITFLIVDHNQWHLPKREAQTIFYSMLLGSLISDGYYVFSGAKHFVKAINIYNGFTTDSTSVKPGLDVTISPAFFAVSTGNGSTRAGGLSACVNF